MPRYIGCYNAPVKILKVKEQMKNENPTSNYNSKDMLRRAYQLFWHLIRFDKNSQLMRGDVYQILLHVSFSTTITSPPEYDCV
mgnify:FL=1